MKAVIGVVTFGAILSVLTGCEGNWQMGSSANNYNESGKWSDVSGTYVGNAGTYLVSNYSGGPITTNTSTSTSNTVSETIGTTTAGQLLYSGGLSQAPLAPDSFSVAVTAVAAGHDDGAGNISGTGIASGTIDYNTGAWNLSLKAAPPDGAGITATYQVVSSSTSGAGGATPGSSGVVINSFTVQQSGNAVSFTDNNGSIYKGSIGLTSTNNTIGGTNVAMTSTVYSYDVSGVSAAGYNVEMVGSFLINGDTVGTNGTILIGTSISGTWLEQHGKTGHISGMRSY